MTDVTQQAQQLYLEGLRLYGENDFDGAIAAYERALEVQPRWTEALHGLSMAHMHAGSLDEAVRIGQQLCELDPDDPFAHTSLSMFFQRIGVAAEQAGDEEQARAMIEAAEKEGARARMLSWKQELKTNPDAAPPGPAGSMDVMQ